MAEEQQQQEPEPETKPEHHIVVAQDLIRLVGSGEDFAAIEGVIKDALDQAHAAGIDHATRFPVDLPSRGVAALEAIADHLGAFRRSKVDEKADIGKMREALQECRQILRHPRMVASNELIRKIDEATR